MESLLSFFPQLTKEQLRQFEALGSLYAEWNEKINVISRKDIDQLYTRHVLHSLSIGLFYDLNQSYEILDVGTGGGFPGIPLAILNPKSQFTLVDSIGKKIKVVNGVAQAIGLKNCIGRHENVKQNKKKYDFVVSRAVTQFDGFLNLVRKNLKQEEDKGILYLKGGDLSEEMKNVAQRISTYSLYDRINDPFFETKKLIFYPAKH